MPFRSQTFCESICHHIFGWTVFQASPSIFNAIPDEMILNVDVFGSCVMFRIVRKGDGSLVIAIDNVLIIHIVADFVEES